MIDPDDPLEIQLAKQQKIISALVRRAERSDDVGSSAYGLFNSAVALQAEVWAKSKDLEHALANLGRASDKLESSETARQEMQRNLVDAVDTMESGFALFTHAHLRICNDLFRSMLPDVARAIAPGMHIDAYFQTLFSSRFVIADKELPDKLPTPLTVSDMDAFLLPISGDKWFQITRRNTKSGNIVVLQTDVTGIVRHNQAEKAQLIDDQSRFLRTAFDHMNIGVCSFAGDGFILHANSRFSSLIGIEDRFCEQGKNFEQLFEHFKKRCRLPSRQHDAPAFIQRQDFFANREMEWSLRHRSGRMLALNKHILPDGNRLLTVQDVTAEHQTKEMLEQQVARRTRELTDLNDRLIKQNKSLEAIQTELEKSRDEAEAAVSSKTRFLAAASHDLLQPVNAAKLFLSTFADNVAHTDMAPMVDRLKHSFAAIETILHDLLEISKLDSAGVVFNRAAFPVQNMFDAIEADTAAIAHRAGLELTFMPSRLWINSDQRYLLRSVQNLVLNAIQYTPKGRVLIGCRRKGGGVVIQVWDTGVGIKPKDQARIFDAFTRINRNPAVKGMGLGLSIVEQACRQLDHTVSLCSEPGKGSVFSICVPIAAPESDEGADDLPQSDATQDDIDLIAMVVEDDPDVRDAMVQRLEMWGAAVLAVASTSEAIEQASSIGIAPDILLVDYDLGNGDTGVQTIQALREITGTHIPAIMITATRSDTLLEQGKIMGFTVLTKPVQLNLLHPLIAWKTRDKSSG